MSKIFALYDSDSIFATRFMEYFKNKRMQDWDVSAFTREESLGAFLPLHTTEILLLGTSLDTLKEDEQIRYIYRYTQESSEECLENFIIYKYQPVERVMEKLLNDYRRRQNEGIKDDSRSVTFQSIFSLRNDPQDILFAWSAAFQLAKQKNVLFLPLELLSIPILPFLEQTKGCLSDLIYYLKEKSNPDLKLRELIGYYSNLSYLSGAAHAFDLLSLNTEDVQQLLEILQKSKDYQTIIFYLGYYHEAGIELLRQSDQVLLLKGNEAIDHAVYTEWSRQMNCIGFNPGQEKFRSISLPQQQRDMVGYRTFAELNGSNIWHRAEEHLLRG